MLVKDCMTRHPIMISPETPASEAQKLMAEHGIRHLPVCGDGKRLAGLVTRSCFAINTDLLGSLDIWEISRRLADVRVAQLMIAGPKVVTVTPDRTVERAASMLNESRIGCLPVIEDDMVVGIITESDLMNALQEMLGLPSLGIRVTMRVMNQRGEFARLLDHVTSQGWGVMGIGSYPTRRDKNKYDIVLKIPEVTIDDARRVLEEISGQDLVDIRSVV